MIRRATTNFSTRLAVFVHPMVAISRKVPAFFDSINSPTAGSAITSQAERPKTPPTSALSFQSELPTNMLRRSQTPQLVVNKSIEKQVRFQHKRASSVLTRSATPESSIASSDESDSGATVSTDTDNPDCSKIPKPEGEPGRPGRGGYNLERAIDWPVKDYKNTGSGMLLCA